MHAISAIKSACLSALDAHDEDPAGRLLEYQSIADPRTVLELVQMVEQYEQRISEEELQALGKLIRELTGYIKMNGGIKPNDPVRDDLLLQARQLLDITEI